jgi:TonB family protein
MRRILAASLLVAPFLLSAAAHASQPSSDAVASPRPLSTGVKPAHVLYIPRIDLTPAAAETMPPDAEVVLKLNVDADGQPQDVQVVKSPNHYLDAPVSAAVRQTRFRPATLDHQPVATDLTLTVVVQQ